MPGGSGPHFICLLQAGLALHALALAVVYPLVLGQTAGGLGPPRVGSGTP